MLPFEEQRILALKPSITGAPDKLCWLGTESGTFTTKSGYAAALNNRGALNDQIQDDPPFDWKKNVWNLQTLPKIKLFVWKVFYEALPVGKVLLSRQYSSRRKMQKMQFT